MIMTNEEICRDYRMAKQKQKQIAILADLNQCSRKEIVEILIAGGCELPGNYAKKKPQTEQAAPDTPCSDDAACPSDTDKEPDACISIAVHDALPILIRMASLKVIEDMTHDLGDSEDDLFMFLYRVEGVLKLCNEFERRCEKCDD